MRAIPMVRNHDNMNGGDVVMVVVTVVQLVVEYVKRNRITISIITKAIILIITKAVFILSIIR